MMLETEAFALSQLSILQTGDCRQVRGSQAEDLAN